MIEYAEWQEVNQRYLSTALQWLRLKLAGSTTPRANQADRIDQLSAELVSLEHNPNRPVAAILANQFGLSQFELRLLLLCAAMEFDTEIPRACAAAHGDPQRPFPTFALALSLLDEPVWNVMAPESALRYWQLIEINPSDPHPLISRQLRANERIVNYLKGLNHLDARLLSLAKPAEAVNIPALPESHARVATELEADIRRAAAEFKNSSLVVQLAGADRPAKQEIASELSRRLGLQQFKLSSGMLPSHALEIDQLAAFGAERLG